MYYTTSGLYRKQKQIIDYINIALTVVIGILFILILFFRGRSGMLFTAEFAAGGLMNALSSAKAFMDKKRVTGVVLIVVTVLLFLMAFICWKVVAGY